MRAEQHRDRAAGAKIQLAEGLGVDLPAEHIGLASAGPPAVNTKMMSKTFKRENHLEDDDDGEHRAQQEAG